MRRLLTAAALALAACATMSAPAWADTQPRSIIVNANASRPISQSSKQAAVDATYRAVINDAIDSAQTKAASIAAKIGATLGPVLTVTENYGDVWCPNSDQAVPGPLPPGKSGGDGSARNAPGSLRLPPIKHPKSGHGKRGSGKRGHAASESPTCTISAAITVSYQIS